jgi:hypothetical protein
VDSGTVAPARSAIPGRRLRGAAERSIGKRIGGDGIAVGGALSTTWGASLVITGIGRGGEGSGDAAARCASSSNGGGTDSIHVRSIG